MDAAIKYTREWNSPPKGPSIESMKNIMLITERIRTQYVWEGNVEKTEAADDSFSNKYNWYETTTTMEREVLERPRSWIGMCPSYARVPGRRLFWL